MAWTDEALLPSFSTCTALSSITDWLQHRSCESGLSVSIKSLDRNMDWKMVYLYCSNMHTLPVSKTLCLLYLELYRLHLSTAQCTIPIATYAGSSILLYKHHACTTATRLAGSMNHHRWGSNMNLLKFRVILTVLCISDMLQHSLLPGSTLLVLLNQQSSEFTLKESPHASSCLLSNMTLS